MGDSRLRARYLYASLQCLGQFPRICPVNPGSFAFQELVEYCMLLSS
jgi:hypothetical protein